MAPPSEVRYEWPAAARAYGLDSIVPAQFTVDVAALGLMRAPRGAVTVVRTETGGVGSVIGIAG